MAPADNRVRSENPEEAPSAARPAADGEPSLADRTVDLIEEFRRGNDAALDTILRRSVPELRRWAHRRLPDTSRGMLDTADLVQDTVMSVLRHLDGFEARRQGALQAYLRQAVKNRIRDLARRDRCRPRPMRLPDGMVDGTLSPLEQMIGSENIARYEAALKKLSPRDREAIVGRLELQYSYEQLAIVLGAPTANAARVAISRAMKRLVDVIAVDG